MQPKEHTLDPEDEKSWEDLKQLGHQMVDDMLDNLRNIRDKPVWQPVPAEVKQFFSKEIPYAGRSEEEIYQDFLETILPYPQGNIHPRFWGWVNGSGTPSGALVELLIGAININAGGRDHIANYVEKQIVEWSKTFFGFCEEASGALTSGCSMANLIGLTIGRNIKSGTDADIRQDGIQNRDKPLTFYGSDQIHSSLQKAVEILGVGNRYLRKIQTNDDFTIDLSALRRQIDDDITMGFQPCCIIGNVGTVNTGAIDDIKQLRQIADQYDMWLHLDGAFGSMAILSEEYRHLLEGINSADSLAFDWHKWMHIPYDVGMILVRSEKHHRTTFSLRPEYLQSLDRGLSGGGVWFSEYTIQLSRNFRALKIWMELNRNGLAQYGKLISQNIKQAQYFETITQKEEHLQVLAPVSLNVVCFRYFDPDVENLDLLNQELLMKLHERGKVVPSGTTINGKFCLRIAITNHRSKLLDFDLLRDEVLEVGQYLATNLDSVITSQQEGHSSLLEQEK